MINLFRKKRSCLISIGLMACFPAAIAQKAPAFTWEAKLPRVDSPSFYRIPVTPALSAKAFRNGAWDVRIFGDSAEVPYVALQSFKTISPGDFKAYPTPVLESHAGKETVIVFEQEPHATIREFGLRYANTAVPKKVVLTGSPDQIQWYAIRPPFLLDPSSAMPVPGKETILEETITIPASGFKYYKLVIDDSASAPLQINCVGFRSQKQERPLLQEVPGAVVKLLTGKDRRSDRFLITLPQQYPLKELSLSIARPQLYHREASLWILEDGKEQAAGSQTLRSDAGVNSFSLDEGMLYDSLVMIVENGDSPPLEPEQVKAWQSAWSLVAKLEPGNYNMKGGAPGLHTPEYDATYFSAAYHRQAGTDLVPGDPVVVKGNEVVETLPTFFTTRNWIWAGIIIVVGLLAFVVRGMLKDMKKEKN